MISIARYLFAGLALAALLASAAEEELDVKPATDAAEAWLAVVDGGNYGASWEQAAPMFKAAIDKVKWETTIDAARAPLGIVNRRKLRSANFTRTLPNAPPGEYVVIRYDTAFDNRPLSSEIVTPMRDADGTWRISGYIIR